MKSIFIFSFLAFFSFKASCQNKEATNYLLLGLLNDYNGRLLYKSIDNQVERFYPFEKPLVEFIDSMLLEENRHYQILSEDGFFYLNSKSIAKFVNSFYTFKTDSAYILSNPERDKWELTYKGRINDSQITNHTFLKNFIIGTFLRYGEKNGDLYTFRFFNSISKASYFLNLITLLECSDITRTHINSIPGQTMIQFKPTVELRICLEKYEYLRTSIIQSRSSLFQKK